MEKCQKVILQSLNTKFHQNTENYSRYSFLSKILKEEPGESFYWAIGHFWYIVSDIHNALRIIVLHFSFGLIAVNNDSYLFDRRSNIFMGVYK